MDCGALRLAGRAAGTAGATAAMNCDPAELASLSRCYCFGSKWRSVLAYIYCQWANNLTPQFSWEPANAVMDWTDSGGAKSGDLETFYAAADLSSVYEIKAPGLGITSLQNLSSLPALSRLECENNLLTELDVSNCTALTYLSCFDNSLATLNLSNCSALDTLSCYNNALTVLDVSSCILLDYLECSGNSLNQAAVDSVLCKLVDNGVLNGTLNITSNSAPSGPGVMCSLVLEGPRGWLVFHD